MDWNVSNTIIADGVLLDAGYGSLGMVDRGWISHSVSPLVPAGFVVRLPHRRSSLMNFFHCDRFLAYFFPLTLTVQPYI